MSAVWSRGRNRRAGTVPSKDAVWWKRKTPEVPLDDGERLVLQDKVKQIALGSKEREVTSVKESERPGIAGSFLHRFWWGGDSGRELLEGVASTTRKSVEQH